MINVFRLQPSGMFIEIPGATLYYGGGNETLKEIKGGKYFASASLDRSIEDALNYLETNGYAFICMTHSENQNTYHIITRKV